MHALLPLAGQFATQHLPCEQLPSPAGHEQVPPHPSLMHALLPFAGQFATQQTSPEHFCPAAQGHLPPQPSLPHFPASHFGAHSQTPCTHFDCRLHDIVHVQVSTQLPLAHTLPAGQTTPAHGFFTHAPDTQNSSALHATLSQGLALGTQVR